MSRTGFAHRETAWQQVRRASGLDEAQWAGRLRGYLDRATAHDPMTARLIGARLRLTSDESFEFGLECLLDGIAARLATGGAEPGS